MGQHADDLIEQMTQVDWPSYRKYKPFKPKWCTADGRTMYVEDMTTQHIINSINKHIRDGREPYWALQAELDKRT